MVDNVMLAKVALASERPSPVAAPLAFALSQNYPNPFNPGTTIGYAVGHRDRGVGSADVRVAVSDMLGREVAVLANEKGERGNYTITWNAAVMASGVYFCRMTAGDYTDVKRMVLVR